MPDDYTSLVTDLKAMTQGEGTQEITLPVVENSWDTRPDSDSYGIVSLDFEVGALYGDNVKKATAYEGSFDLFSISKDGAGWLPIIKNVLTKNCDGCWSLNSHQYERETGLFHWEWSFQVED